MIRFRTFLAIVTIFGLIVFFISRGPQQEFERTALPSVSRSDVEAPKFSRDVTAADTDEATPKVRPEMAAANRDVAAAVTDEAAPKVGPEMAVANRESDEISPLMERARRQAADWALTTPAGNNALETYKEILTLEPDYKPALEGIKQLGIKYAEFAEIAKQRGELARAERYLLKAIELAPDHPSVQALQVTAADTDEATPKVRPEMAVANREINLGDPIWVEGDKPANSSAVSRVQSGLSRLAYDPGPVDGVMGSKTEAAIRNYERDHNLLVDGRPTVKLARHIEELLQAERLVQNYCKRYGKRAVSIGAGPIGSSTVKHIRAYDCVNPADLHD